MLNLRTIVLSLFLTLAFVPAWADEFSDTKKMFEDAGVAEMFDSAYGYALFPTIGKAGVVVFGGAFGKGRVYEQGTFIGDTEMTQVSVGVQLGGTGFSQVVFFEDVGALERFTSGKFEFGIKVQATVLTASGEASANTAGSSSTASGTKNNAVTEGSGYNQGMATFTITKGGLMYEVSLGGQQFSFKKR